MTGDLEREDPGDDLMERDLERERESRAGEYVGEALDFFVTGE